MNPTRSRFPRLAALALAAVTLLGACGDDNDSSGANGTTDTSASSTDLGKGLKLVQAGKFTVCSDIPYAPFEYEEGGQVVGIDVDIMKAIGGRLGILNVEFKDTDFDGIFAALKAGNCDVIASSVSITEERKKENLFSEGYYEIQQSLLVSKANAEKYKDCDSLKGQTVAVQSETTGAAFAKKECEPKGVTLKEFTGADDMFTALKAGQVAGIIQDLPINAYNAKTTGETVVSKKFDSEKEQYGIVIPQGRDDLKKAIDNALTQIKADDTYRTILRNHLGDSANV